MSGRSEIPLAEIRAEDYPAAPVCGESLSPRFLRHVRAVPLAVSGDTLDLAMADPLDLATLEAVALATGLRVRPRSAAAADLDAAFARLYGEEDRNAGLGAMLEAEPEAAEGDVERLRDLASEAPIVRVVNQIIAEAVARNASDIHAETFEDALRIRYRVDGVLVERESLPRHAAAAIVSRLKLMAGLDIAERRLPQDGRIKVSTRGKDVDFRVATSPVLHGESVVLRILDRAGVRLDFGSLGFPAETLAAFLSQLDRPEGFILVAGPTGSGKTTTLYTALERLNRPSRKIVTVEDPVEYQLRGVNQIQVRPEIGLDFAGVLRSTLRHDPDIVMIGEIRDEETARIAVQAALTGHMVLSTIHTNGAAATVTRLLDLGVSDFLLASTLRAVVAQRLVRVLCPHCREPHRLPSGLAAEIGLAPDVTVYRAAGCPACEGRGYHGRIGVFEVLTVTDTLRDGILSHHGRSVLAAPGKGLFEDGIRKVLAGVTSLEEVWAAVGDGG